MNPIEKKLRVAIIGVGKMGMHHAKAIAAVADVAQLVAVADPTAKAEKLRPLLPEGVAVYTDAKTMLVESKPDVVHIVTPPHTHVPMATLALEHGAHVYVEKPFALDAASARTVTELARAKGLSVCAGHQVLFQDAGREYRKHLDMIDEVVHVESYFSFKTVRRGPGGAMSPVEQLIDILPHPTYLLLSAFESHTPGAVELESIDVDAKGEARAVLRKGEARALLVVTLRGRPIESYLRIVGTNGSIRADFVLSGVTKLFGPGASAISAVFKPFSEARQMVFGTIGTLFRMITRRHKSYAGLAELAGLYYRSILDKSPSPVSPESIVDTVRICEEIGKRLRAVDAVAEEQAQRALETAERQLGAPDTQRGTVLVTGGTGFLGRVAVEEFRRCGWAVRAITRRVPTSAFRVAGVEYVRGDLADDQPDQIFKGVSVIAHLAAETAGGQDEHERNSIQATCKMMEAAARHGIRRFVHVSSIAVLKPRRAFGKPLDESTPVDAGNLGRGPYVWGKAESEAVVAELGNKHGIGYRIIRLGPLVDFQQYAPPGRLGREVGPLFVAIGGKRNVLSVCDVRTAARVLRYYLDQFDVAPPMLNLVEAPAPTRRELAQRLLDTRRDLRVMWMPAPVLMGISWLLRGVLRAMSPRKKALNLYAAFASERYNSALAEQVITAAVESGPVATEKRQRAVG